MESIRNLAYVLLVSFGVSFLGGVFTWNLSDGFTMFLGLVDVVCIVWLVVVVSGKEFKSKIK